MIPVYAIVSIISYKYYKYAIYWEVGRDCYEAFAISSFFHLLCYYIAPTLHDQKNYFRTVNPRNWVWPMGWIQCCTGGKDKGIFRRPRSGLTWFNVGGPRSRFGQVIAHKYTDYMALHLPILCCTSRHDFHRYDYSTFGTLLRIFAASQLCSRMGHEY
jgi:hypothetical protein